MNKSIFGLLLAFLCLGTLRADQPIFNIGSATANNGETIDIDFHVDDFADIVSAQFTVSWNPDVLEFKALKNLNANVPGLTPSSFNTTMMFVEQGNFTMSWLEASTNQITIDDGSLFFTVEFEVVGEPCDFTSIALTSELTEIEVSEDGVNNIGLVSNNGAVNVPGVNCVQDIQFIGNEVIGACGEQACVKVTVNNFIDVGTMNFSLSYDPDVLQYVEFNNFAPLLAFGDGNVNIVTPGLLRVVWFNNNVENESLPDGSTLFDICFTVVGGGGTSSEIDLSNDPEVMVTDIDGQLHNVLMTPAKITAQCALEGFAFIADSICTQPGETICMDVRVNDFDEIVAFQHSISWDSTKFEFVSVGCFGNLPGLDENAFGTPGNPDVKDGQLTVSWLDLSLEGESLPDGTVLFCLCLRAVGPLGTNTPIQITGSPLEIEILNAQDSVLEYSLVQGVGQILENCEELCQISVEVTSTTNPTCPRNEDGAINITVIESCPETPSYVWSTTPPQMTQDLSNVGAGIYTVTITVGSQIIIVSDTLFDPPAIGVTSVIVDPVPITSNNGSINLTVTGGLPPYSFMWSDTTLNVEDRTMLSTGFYFVTITDANGCTFIPDPFAVGAEVSGGIMNVTCNGGNDGKINLSASFGTGPYTFMWNTTPPQTTEDLMNLTAGTYCVTITDSQGATRDTCFMVTEPSAINTAASVVTHDVNENCMGAIDLVVTGGTMPYTYKWSHGSMPMTQDVTGLCGGMQYCVTITDGNQCTVTRCFNVILGNIGVGLTASNYNGFGVSCNDECDGMITAEGQGVPPLTYMWSNSMSGPVIDDLCAGTYTVTVTDGSGNTATNSIVLTEPDPLEIAIQSTLPSDPGSSDGAVSAVVNGGVLPYEYLWLGKVSGTTAALDNLSEGIYTISVTDDNGCTATEIVDLLVGGECFSGMSIFTPNSDGFNDQFIIRCSESENNTLYIFNRAGAQVYEATNYLNNWIGVDEDGEPLPDGAYLWVLEVRRPGQAAEVYRGTVYLLRTAD